MTPLIAFIAAATALTVLVLAILLRPLWRPGKPSSAVDRREANLTIFRDQMRELERERDEGSLAETDFAQAKQELQRRLLEEVDTLAVAGQPGTGRAHRRTLLVLLIILPLAAMTGYALLGNPQALAPLQSAEHMSQQEIDGLLQRLVERLKANPDDHKGWIMLARSYKALGRFAESAEAYSHGGTLLEGDAALLADYAEVLARANGDRFDGKPDELLKRALKLDPDEPQALFLAGASSSERKDFASAARYWQRLLVQLEPGSEEAKSMEAAIAKAREIAGIPTPKTSGKTPGGGSASIDAGRQTISGEAILSGKLVAQAHPDDTLFIFARPAEGSRMPLAVLRARVADLPLKFSLDDSTALPGGQKLSGAAKVTLEARIAKAGMAQTSSGDLFGTLDGVTVGRQDIRLVIDRVQP